MNTNLLVLRIFRAIGSLTNLLLARLRKSLECFFFLAFFEMYHKLLCKKFSISWCNLQDWFHDSNITYTIAILAVSDEERVMSTVSDIVGCCINLKGA